jgi:exopolysaccharide production protein ExoQ
MPPIVALALVIAVLAVLLVMERRTNPEVSPALWIPFFWIFFIGTRFPTQWLSINDAPAFPGADEYLEGSPLDMAVFLSLYVMAVVVLMRRSVSVTSIMAANAWVTAFLLYGLLSVVWSDYPWIAIKRFIKVSEHVVMVLVVLTDKHPWRALDALLRRFLAMAVLLSVLFFKYFPELGRSFDYWTGRPFNTGVTTDKNALGHICLLGAAFYTSSLLSSAHGAIGQAVKGRALADAALLIASLWLLNLADAKTALASTLLCMATIAVFAWTRLGRSPGAVLFCIASVVGVGVVLEWAFDLRELGIQVLGRDASLTDRVYVWADVLAMPNNVVIGTGFESFWLGQRLELLWEKYWWRPNQSHNGYIETYINLGVVGLVLLLTMIGAGFARSLQRLQRGDAFAPLMFALVVAIALFNYTDATFKALHVLYFTFFLVVIASERAPSMHHVSEIERAVPAPNA